MIKKVTLVLILFCMLFSCGKKGDPEYKNLKKEVRIESLIINKT